MGDRRREGFLDAAFPPPGSPQATSWRLISSTVLILFICVLAFLGAMADAPSKLASSWRDESWLGDWVWSRGVSWTGAQGGSWQSPQVWPEGVDPPIEPGSDLDPILGGEELDDEAPDAVDKAEAAAADADLLREPDLSRYVWHRDLPWKASSANGRLIVIGDIHGAVASLRSMLDQLAYEQGRDTLVLVGDLVAKASSIQDSLAVVALAREVGAHAVRGNHDQTVIGFRLWQDYNNQAFSALADEGDDATLADATWLDTATEPTTLRKKLPRGWKWRSQHFEIARRLPKRDFRWLLDRSLTLHIRSLHTYIVHAGLLPESIPRSSTADDDDEPDTAHADLESTSPSVFTPSPETKDRHMTADDAVLLRRQNRSPNTLLEMRGVTKHGTKPHSDGHKGEPWPGLWDEAMADCERTKQCRSLAIIYGHWAARGLSIGSHSIGLDSGCVYGRSLSALVVEPDGGSVSTYGSKLERAAEARLGRRDGVVYSLKCPDLL